MEPPFSRPPRPLSTLAPSCRHLSPTWAKTFYEGGWQPPLLLAVGLCAVGLLGAIGYFVLERGAERRFKLERVVHTDRFVWRDLLSFDRSFWYITGLCVTFYSVIFPFRSTFAIKYFQHAHGLSLQEAGKLNGYVFLAAIFATPAFGLLVDRVDRRALFMVFGSLLLFAVFPMFTYTDWNLWISTVLIGIYGLFQGLAVQYRQQEIGEQPPRAGHLFPGMGQRQMLQGRRSGLFRFS